MKTIFSTAFACFLLGASLHAQVPETPLSTGAVTNPVSAADLLLASNALQVATFVVLTNELGPASPPTSSPTDVSTSSTNTLVIATNALQPVTITLLPSQPSPGTLAASGGQGAGLMSPLSLTAGCVQPPSALIGWWRAENNALDSVGGNAGQLINGTGFGGGKVGQAFLFNGTSQYVSLPNLATPNFTMEAWIYPSSQPSGQAFLFGQSYGRQLIVQPLGAGLRVGIYITTSGGSFYGLWDNADQIPIGQWTHLAATWDGTYLVIYLNGNARAQAAPGFSTIGDSGCAFSIGACGPCAPSQYFPGLIDEMSLYSRALSAYEIANIVQAGSDGKCPPQDTCTPCPAGAVAWWPGEQNASDVFGVHDGTPQNPLAFVTGEVGDAFSFTGSNSVQVPNSGLICPSWSMEAWIKPTASIGAQGFILGQCYGRQMIARPGNKVAVAVSPNGYTWQVLESDPIPIGWWTHVVGTYDAGIGRLSLYVNGIGRSSTPGVVPWDSLCAWSMGGLNNVCATSGQWFSGAVDEVTLYNSALSSAQVQGIYNARVAGKCRTPTIISGPMSQTAYWGDSVTFSVQALGSPPLSYQWRFAPLGGAPVNITGATDSSLTLDYVSDSVLGSYSVEVFNSAGSTVSANAVLTTPSSAELYALPVVGARQDYRFKGDTTYYVDGSAGPVQLYGTTVIEGGAVIKFARNANAKLVINGPLKCQTSPWGPAIFTAQDDNTVGYPVNSSTGLPTEFYAQVALEITSGQDTVLTNARIAYAQTAIHYLGSSSRQVLGTVRHAQILHCGAGFVSDGTANQPCVLNLANVLLADVGQAVSGSHFRGSAQHLTVDRCTTFVSDSSSSALGFFVTNSIFANVTSLGAGAGLNGSNNGFYPPQGPLFGAQQATDDEPPFAPTGTVDEQNNPVTYVVNGQGAYYLRDGSPFEGPGTTGVDSGLKADFAQMTTDVPPDLFSDDVNSSMTLGPKAPRDAQAANLGYHYPVIDYVLMLATVNNATLNIDQGTVLGLAGCSNWWGNWGLRLNPGGRLNVNGVPTNRVVFAHLEAVQESPIEALRPWGPMITWRELYFDTGPPTPYPEARIQYADFPTLSGGWNGHFAPIDDGSEYLACSYSVINNLQLDGCHLQGGWFIYDDGGPPNRVLKLLNTVFDRCEVCLYDAGFYELYFDAPGYSAQVTAANNLFYHSFMMLAPVAGTGAGASWTFTDNLFDNAYFYTDSFYSSFYNGPVGVNHHNAYVGMSSVPNGGGRLKPAAPTTTDPDLPLLSYDTGALGRFYLPATATSLIRKGSRTAGAAGEYHFTCVTNNQKEAGGQVSIGPHYLALAGGGVPDSNGDGIPDFLADRNGDGNQGSDEVPWASANNLSLAILSPTANSIVSGIVQLEVALGPGAASVASIVAEVDGMELPGATTIMSPAMSSGLLEIDTRRLQDGQHSFVLRSIDPTPTPGFPGPTAGQSPAVILQTANSFRYPGWWAMAEGAIHADVEIPHVESRYGELDWCDPRGRRNSTVCNQLHYLVFYLRLPEGQRSLCSGHPNRLLPGHPSKRCDKLCGEHFHPGLTG